MKNSASLEGSSKCSLEARPSKIEDSCFLVAELLYLEKGSRHESKKIGSKKASKTE